MIRILNTIDLLSQEPSRQIAYLSALEGGELSDVEIVDELALEFDDVYRPAVSRFDEFGISRDAQNAISELDAALKQMSGPANAPLWSREALFESDEWEKIRMRARNCLALLGPQSINGEAPPQ